MRRRWIVLAVAGLLLVAAAVVWVVLERRDDRGRLSAALALAPESTERFTWTDWAGVRAELDADLTADSPAGDVDDFLLEAFDRDLVSTTVLDTSAATIHAELGFSPATIDWELVAQGERGALILMGLGDAFDVEALRSSLRRVGFTEPDEDDGVWIGGVDLLEELSGPVTPELSTLQIDEDAGLLVAGDRPSYLEARAEEARGDREDGVSDVGATMEEALTAAVYDGDHACSALAMSQAAPADRTRAAELVEEAGEVGPVTAYAIGGLPGGDVRVALGFESDEQARTNADARAVLASGPAPGQGGSFPERFALGDVVADGRVVTLELAPVDGASLVSDLSHGPVLFATC